LIDRRPRTAIHATDRAPRRSIAAQAGVLHERRRSARTMSPPMNSVIHHLMLTAQVRTGFSPSGLICAAVAALSVAIAGGFGLLVAFILLAQRFDPLTAGLAMAGLFLAIAVIAGLIALLIRRRTIARAQRELAARRSVHWPDPRLVAVGLQVGQALGWRRLMTVAAVGVLAAGFARDWAGRSSRDTPPPQ
jgi:hypothetical protein